jgi:hypothetical protein
LWQPSLQGLDDVEDMFLRFLGVLGVDESRYLADELHQDGHSGAEEGFPLPFEGAMSSVVVVAAIYSLELLMTRRKNGI